MEFRWRGEDPNLVLCGVCGGCQRHGRFAPCGLSCFPLGCTMESPYRVYVLECSDGSTYTGMTGNLDQRVQSHNAPHPTSTAYTARRGPVKLLHAWQACCKVCARKDEVRVKGMSRDRRLRATSSPETFVPSSCRGRGLSNTQTQTFVAPLL